MHNGKLHSGPGAFPPGYQERFQATVEATSAANVAPLPGPLLNAWLPAPLKAAGFTLRPVVASDWAFLQRIESPILRELAELQKPAEERELPSYSDEEIWELVYLWTIQPHEARATLAGGLHAWRETVMLNTADQLPGSVISDKAAILAAIAAHILNAVATSVGYEATTGEDKIINFTQPPAAPATASAGG